MKNNLIFFLNLLSIALFSFSLIILDKSPEIAIFCIAWSIFYFLRTYKEIIKIKAFTLIELIAVITIMAVLLTITLNIKPDKDKRDIRVLHSQLKASQIYSLENKDIVIPFESEVKLYTQYSISNGNLYFKNGNPVNSSGQIYNDCILTVGEYFIKINAFTGKLSFH